MERARFKPDATEAPKEKEVRGPYRKRATWNAAEIDEFIEYPSSPLRDNEQAKRAGRPSRYHPIYDDIVFGMRLLGASAEQICRAIHIEVNTLYLWLDQNDKFYEAWTNGGELADAEAARSLFHRATGYSHPETKVHFDKDGDPSTYEVVRHYPPDPAALQFFLTNRRGDKWKSKQTTELTGPDGQALQPPSVTINGVVPQGQSPVADDDDDAE